MKKDIFVVVAKRSKAFCMENNFISVCKKVDGILKNWSRFCWCNIVQFLMHITQRATLGEQPSGKGGLCSQNYLKTNLLNFTLGVYCTVKYAVGRNVYHLTNILLILQYFCVWCFDSELLHQFFIYMPFPFFIF